MVSDEATENEITKNRKVISFSVSIDEFRFMQKAAAKTGRSVNNWIKGSLFQEQNRLGLFHESSDSE